MTDSLPPPYYPIHRRSAGGSSKATKKTTTTTASKSTASSSSSSSSSAPPPPTSSRGPPPAFQTNHFAVPPPRWYRPATTTTPQTPPQATASTNVATTPYSFDWNGLTNEIHDLCRYIQLSKEERASRDSLIEHIKSTVTGMWDDVQVVLYGSYALDLSLPTSDVDLAIVFGSSHDAARQKEKKENSSFELKHLHLLAAKLSQCASGQFRTQVIDQCRVPVIHVHDTWTGATADISMTLPHMDRVVAMQRQWLEAEPMAKELILVTKVALKQWGLSSTFSGGLSSTCVYLLVHRYLQDKNPISPSRTTTLLCTPLKLEHINTLDYSSSSTGSTPTSSDGLSSVAFPSSEVSTPEHCTTPVPLAIVGDVAVVVAQSSSSSSGTPPPSQIMVASTDSSSLSPRLPTPPPPSGATTLAHELIDFWKYCSNDVFSCGYLLSNCFAPEETFDPLADVSKGAFRLAEIHFLVKHSITVMAQLLEPASWTPMFRLSGRPASILSSVLADPRQAVSPTQTSSHRRRSGQRY